MKLPITLEVVNAPAQYVGTFFYESGLSASLTKKALAEQCDRMLAMHIETQNFDDFEEYVEWVRETGTTFLEALEQDFTRHREWWTKEPDVAALQGRIRRVLSSVSQNIKQYSN